MMNAPSAAPRGVRWREIAGSTRHTESISVYNTTTRVLYSAMSEDSRHGACARATSTPARHMDGGATTSPDGTY